MGNGCVNGGKQQIPPKRRNHIQLFIGKQKRTVLFTQNIHFGKRPTKSQILNAHPEVREDLLEAPQRKAIYNQKILEDDDRKLVEKTQQYPYSAIGLLAFYFNSQKYTGTGFLVAPNIVLTCAHNCYDQKWKQCQNMIFYPGLNGPFNGGIGYPVKQFHFLEQYKNKINEEYDYALLQLHSQVDQDYHGYLGVDFQQNYQEQVFICGYPGYVFDKNQKKKGNKQMYISQGPSCKLPNQRMKYQVSTSAGQSGSPIFYWKGEMVFVIGIHTNQPKDKAMNFNEGIMLTDRKRKQFINWIGIESEILKSEGRKKIKMEWFDNYENFAMQNIDLGKNEIMSGDLQYFINAKFPKLRVLKLGKNKIRQSGAALLKKGQWPFLNCLSIQQNFLGDEGVKQLLEGKWYFLNEIDLSNNQLTFQSLLYIKQQSNWANMNKFRINQNFIKDYGAQILAEVDWPLLSELSLFENKLTSDGIQKLCKKSWQYLMNLQLTMNSIQKKGAIGLVWNKYLNLKRLFLDDTFLGDQSMEELRSAKWPQLKLLSLKYNQITNLGVKYLIQGVWKNLQNLYLDYNPIGDQGFQNLRKANWPRLMMISLQNNKITREGVQKLYQMKTWLSLKKINLYLNPVRKQDLNIIKTIINSQGQQIELTL